MTAPTIHATALLVGHRGILIRGPSGSGKSRLAASLMNAAGESFVRLVGDDRIHLEAAHGRLLMRPAAALAGLIEIRGLGVVRVPFEPVAVTHAVIDLKAGDAMRLPESAAMTVEILGIRLARLPVAPEADAQPLLLAFLGPNAGRQYPGSA